MEPRKTAETTLRKDRGTAKGKFTRKVNLFRERHARGDPYDVLSTIYDEIVSTFKLLEERCEHLISFLEDSDQQEEVKEACKYLSDSDNDRCDVLRLLFDAKSNDVSTPGGNCQLKVEALKPPRFEGGLRDYPSFKDDFMNIISSKYGKNPFALRQCLGEKPLKVILGCEKDFDEMFKRLDKEYGDPRKLVDNVISDLRSIKIVKDGDDRAFVDMVCVVERCYLDLQKVNLEKEMNSVSIVSMIERLMPRIQKREWIVKADGICNKDLLFPELLNFLLCERRVIEYSASSVRNIRSETSNVCNLRTSEVDDPGLRDVIKRLQEDQQNINRSLEEMRLQFASNTLKTNRGSNNKRCWVHDFDGHNIGECGKFRSLNSLDRLEITKRKGACFRCLGERHVARMCKSDLVCDVKDGEGNICGWNHHPLLHGSFANDVFVKSGSCKSNKAMLCVSTVYSGHQPLTVLWDSGSDITLITHTMARKLHARSRDIMMSMVKVGNVMERCASKEYTINVRDDTGVVHELKVVGMDEISAQASFVDLSQLSNIFPGIDTEKITRPSGRIDMLIGTDYCELFPQVIKTQGKLQLLESRFGFCLRGSHSLLQCGNNNVAQLTAVIHNAIVDVYHTSVLREESDDLKESLDRFFKLDVVGIECTPRCVSCLCKKCPGNGDITAKEERELALIERGLCYKERENRWNASYPWIKHPFLLPNNYKAALARLKSTERRLTRLGPDYVLAYGHEIKDMIQRDVAVKLRDEEVLTYDGPIHFLPHHEVLKPESCSTPVRIVFDSSSNHLGHKLNDYWAKGPNVLNNLLGILFRFRENEVGIVGDISKMYHSVAICKFDQHVHRFLWRDMDLSRDPDQYVLTTVTFGDRPSGAIASTALTYTAEMFQDEYPQVAKTIKENTYMDDVIFSVADVNAAHVATANIEIVLGRGNFHVKNWVISGVEQQCEIRDFSGTDTAKVLGLLWIPAKDEFVFKVLVNFSRKIKGAHKTPGMTKEQCLLEFPTVLTRRMVLRQVASLYDPLGFLVPVTLKAKLMMRSMIRKEAIGTNVKSIDWDEPLFEAHVKNWHDFFFNLYDIEPLSFPRCIKPTNAIKEPMLIIFSDGSRVAYGCCAYLRWQLDSGGYDVYLIASRNRIGPVREITIPRMELCGAVLSCRLRESIERELKLKKLGVMHIVDSTIVCSQIRKESHGFNTFVASRVAEIQCKSDTSEWWWVDSRHNVADLVTKPCEPYMLGKESVWQKGPEFLRKPREEWPVCQNVIEELPDRRSVTLMCVKENKNMLSDIRLENFTNYMKLLKVTSRVLLSLQTKSLKGIFVEPSAENIRTAENMWIKTIQSDMTDWQQRFKSLGPVLVNGIIVVGQRIAKWLKDNWNQEHYILLPAKHPFTRLYISHLHEIDHGGVESTLARLQSRFWVPGARRVIKSVKKGCVLCRKYNGQVEDQCMGQVSDIRMKPTPPFFHTATDLFGPFTIKDTVKRRTRGKCFGVIYTCLTTRAVYLDIAENYSTEAFLSTFKRFVSIRGYPSTMHSDNGPQLVAANKELRDAIKDFDLNTISNFGRHKGVTWNFNKSSDAPWLNGACESLIRLVKNGLLRSVGDSVLTFSELQTIMYEIANLLNNRPIGMKPGYSLELGVYLCPNDLLLGHNNLRVPDGPFTPNENTRKRLDFIQSIVNSFWKRWQRDYFPTLFIRQKWHVKKRNVKVGDIVLVQDPNPVRGKWKLAQVSKVEGSRDGVVREVKLRYKICKPGNHYQGSRDRTMNRSVHRLVVLLPVEEQ